VTPQTVAIIVAAVTFGSFVKGATGQGLPLIAIPVIATFAGVEVAIVVMAIPGLVTNAWLLWRHRSHYRATRDLPALLVMGALGAVIGTFLLQSLDERVLSLVLAAMICLYAFVFVTHPDLKLPERVTRVASPPVGLAAGVLQGATGIAGPIMSTYLHGYRYPQEVYVLSISTIYQVFAVVQVVALAAVGLYTSDRLVLSLLALVPIMAALPLGARLTTRLSRATFDRIVLAILVISAITLASDALS
jgi:uncharacterized membrane protein YfcA